MISVKIFLIILPSIKKNQKVYILDWSILLLGDYHGWCQKSKD